MAAAAAAAAGAGVGSQLDPSITIEGFYGDSQTKYNSAMNMCENLKKSMTDPKIVAAVKNQVTLYGKTVNLNAFMDVVGRCKTMTILTLCCFKEISISDEIQIPEQIESVMFLYSTRKAIEAFHGVVCGKKAWTVKEDHGGFCGNKAWTATLDDAPPYLVTFMPPVKSS